MLLRTALLALVAGLAVAYAPQPGPEDPQQIKLSWPAADGCMTVMWVTNSTSLSAPMVLWGLSPENITQQQSTAGFVKKFDIPTAAAFNQYVVQLTGLESATVYYYAVGDTTANVWSAVYSFRTQVPINSNSSQQFLVYGDMGLQNTVSLPQLAREVASGQFAQIWHVGDLAYNMNDNGGAVGSMFLREIQNLSANIPYQTCPGNHEADYLSDFANYKHRFYMPNVKSAENMWWSADLPLGHVAFYSTEHYFFPAELPFLPEMYKWLEEDLKAFNNNRRSAERPWLILAAHRPLYCTEADGADANTTNYDHDCTKDALRVRKGIDGLFGIEVLLKKYSVDLYICGHIHSYERTYPVFNNVTFMQGVEDGVYTNPLAPVHITTGAAGCPEFIDTFGTRQPWVAAQDSRYSYSVLTLSNSTHLSVEQRDGHDGTVFDSLTIVKDSSMSGSQQ